MKLLSLNGVALFLLALGAQGLHAAEFAPCPDATTAKGLAGSLCAHETVPAAYDSAPGAPGDTVTLFVRKFPSPTPARGTVWLVAGGPGESGASLYPFVPTLRRSFPDFDLIIPDHRGTGYSSRLCPDEEAATSPGGMALEGAEWGTCFGRLNAHPERARQFSITNAAHDLKLLIGRNRGAPPVFVYGVSYGTQLVLRALQVGDLGVDGVVLDSLVPLETAPEWDLSRRSFVVDDVGRKVLAQCDTVQWCRDLLGEPAEAAYRKVLARGAADPALLAEVPGKNLKRFFGMLLDIPAARSRIPYLISDLKEGRTGELKSVLGRLEASFAELGGYPQSPPSIPLVSIISAAENNLRPALTAEEVRREEEGLLFTSSLPGLLVAPSLPRYERDRYFGALPSAFPKMLVMQATLDPKTHYDGALAHVEALRRSGTVDLVSVPTGSHFLLWNAPGCFESTVRKFVSGTRIERPLCVEVSSSH